MYQRRTQAFWSKAGYYALLTLLAVVDVFTGGGWLGGSVDRKRVFSPGFVALCVLVAVFELMVLSHFYGARG
ncbi:hypothetical protein SAMN04515675_6103 [Pseudomonas costantinii]|uniref:Uncharacterized protein n=1 Tax=Pseudomonas costantinii TaxID=168469 RepID=A0A1S2UIG7_9PSED|nr:hypothetical protein [Pseudomonas costantinii]OIN46009.1 hypothetical protein BFL40_27630 [Pseudomonas costantinii]SEE53730.1 hypothetical protein SAMN04515675_6103 [Pseudomonas costantinii]